MEFKNNKILVLGDIHGRENWKQIVQANAWETCIFLGDYFDPYESNTLTQMYENFREILSFHESNPGRVILLLGNHDFHYMNGAGDDNYSRFSLDTFNKVGSELDELYKTGVLQLAYQIEDVVFTHAGVTGWWYWNKCLDGLTRGLVTVNDLEKNNLPELTEEQVREVAQNINQSPLEKFRFSSIWDIYGESKTQSPIWIRATTLATHALKGIRQVVGHTQVRRVVHLADEKIWLVDTLGQSGEALLIDNGEFKVVHVDE